MTENQASPDFRLAFVPGVTPGKWIRIWEQRLPEVPFVPCPLAAPAEAEAALAAGTADAALLRLPVDRTLFSAIPLYTETTVVVLPKDHELTEAEELLVEQLAEQVVWHPQDETLVWETRPGTPGFERPASTADAIELVAAGVGLLLVPQSLARLHHRKDLTYRPVLDAAQSQVALAWPEERTTDLVEEFIGIVRGRTVNSSRGRSAAAQPEPKQQAKARQDAKPRQGAKPKQDAGKKPGGAARKPAAARSRAGSGGGAAGAKRGKPRGRR
ncbi:LysR substrate-binding domain-containing protein [Kitasatospora viridis]|uniref:LysR substrate binding domain-containing protein n=1 Tax=Kitasatospora viridis TaxID=281105 RepID=A0A561TTN3_9ACTN|nr:LysR substrate-binding domain-containing protein [Kitasatospora viridis]TWF90476.1 LysR substrate binding domain-containing protein [Kitasatospora viridis]